MELFIEIVSIVLPVFFVIAFGYGLKQLGNIDQEFVAQANRLVFNVCLPLLLFFKIGTSDFSANVNWKLIAGSSAGLIIIFSLSYFYAHIRRYPPAMKGVFCQGAFRGNLAYVGLAMVSNAFGDDGLTRAAILMGFIVPLLNLLAIIALLMPHHQSGSFSLKVWIKQIILNPLIIGAFFGIAWSFSQFPMPIIMERSLHIIIQMTLPLALIAIGAGFTLQGIKGDLHKAVLSSVFKVLLTPLCTAYLLYLLGVEGLDFSVGLLIAGTPTAMATYIMASQMRGDPDLAGSIVIISTFFSMLTFMILLLGLKWWGA